MRKIKSLIISTILLFITWILLAGFAQQEIIVGLITALVVSLIFHEKIMVLQDIKLGPKSFFFMIGYFFLFTAELIKSNLDVAQRVISPKLPINPGIVKVRTKLKTPLGRAFLANSITLTPGTLTVEMRDEFFYIHWIDITKPDIDGATKSIVSKFENFLEVIFG